MTGKTILTLKRNPKTIGLSQGLSGIFRDELRKLARNENIDLANITRIGIEKGRVQYNKNRGFGISGTMYIDTKERRHRGASQTMYFLWWPVELEAEFKRKYGIDHRQAEITTISGKLNFSGARIQNAKLTATLLVKTGATSEKKQIATIRMKEIENIARQLAKKYGYDEIQYEIQGKGVLK